MNSNFGNFEVSELYVFTLTLRGFQKSFRVKDFFFVLNLKTVVYVGNKYRIPSKGNARP